jgi:hypothetical protein
MVHRGIASLALALAVCFLFLSRFDAQFFLIHFYESLIYLAIVLMLFYFEDRWAYMMGIVAPAAWLALAGLWGGLRSLPQQISPAFHPGSPFFPIGLLTTFAIVLSIAMIASCANRWRREFSGLHKGVSTLIVSLVVVAAYYGIIVIWILRWPPSAV